VVGKIKNLTLHAADRFQRCTLGPAADAHVSNFSLPLAMFEYQLSAQSSGDDGCRTYWNWWNYKTAFFGMWI